MLSHYHPDRIRIAFDDHRLVANAGLILPSTLALRLGLPQLVDRHLDLGHATGRANTGDKMMTLVACPASTIFAGLASISFADSPPRPVPVAGRRWCGSWGRQTPG